MKRITLCMKILSVLVLLFLLFPGRIFADGTYTNLGTTDAGDGSADAINFSQGHVWTIDQYGKYIWLTQNRVTGSHWAWSNDLGANWTEGSETYSFLMRGSVAYDSINDKLHVIWVGTDSNDGVIYRRYGITRDGAHNITAITREDSSNINLQLDTSSSRRLDQPVALWVNDGSTNGTLIAIWSKYGSSLSEVRASMRKLSISAADGVAGNWVALDGSSDTFSTDPPLVAADKVFGATTGANASSAIIRGGSSSRKDDLYVFVAQDTVSSADTIKAYRAVWNSGTLNWSGGWQSPVTVGAMDTSAGYSIKEQLITKPVLDTVHDRLYVGWPRWKTGGSGDTISMAYLNSTDTASSLVDLYSANGTHSYAPTLDIAYDATQDYVYAAYVESTTNGTNGSIDYKTYDGSTVGSQTRFYTNTTGSAGADGGADIPILYESRNNTRLLFGFRINGALPPTSSDKHTLDWGYIPLPTQPTIQFTSSSGSGAESTTSVSLPLSLSGTFSRDVTVNYAVTGGTATGSGTDYTLSSGTATILAGSTSTTIPLTVVNDSIVESDETIIVTASSPTFATLGANTTYTYTITNDDVASSNAPATSNSSAGSNSNTSLCSDAKPELTPNLYAASSAGTESINLYFSDDSTSVSDYAIEYGTASGNYPFSALKIGGKGSRTYTIKSLQKNTTYYFRVRNGNGCTPGNWSNEISAKTNAEANNMSIVNVTSQNTSTPQPSTSPSLSTKPSPTPDNQVVHKEEVKGYSVNVKVVDQQKNPVENAKVTLHSNPQTAYSDKNGIAHFTNVEKGEHKVQIAYNNYQGEQQLSLAGDVKEFNINVEIKKTENTASHLYWAAIGGGLVLVIVIVLILVRRRR